MGEKGDLSDSFAMPSRRSHFGGMAVSARPYRSDSLRLAAGAVLCPVRGEATPADLNAAFSKGSEARLKAALADRCHVESECPVHRALLHGR
jgi:hypothetical protein